MESMLQITAYVELGLCWIAWSLAFVNAGPPLQLTGHDDLETLMTKCNARFEMPVEGTAHANKKARNKKLCERRIFELLDKESKSIVNLP
jgi:hypothetical protein